jgi:hypothetical protein
LPDDIFSNQKIQFRWILEGLGTSKVGIIYDQFEYIREPFGTFYGHLVEIWYIFPVLVY